MVNRMRKRMLPMKRLATWVALLALLIPAAAAGETSVTVLGLRSASAEEDFARDMTAALRQAAESASSGDLVHTGRENDLNQLLIVFDCEGPTPQCLQRVGESLESNRLIYGLVEPESGRSDAGFAVTLGFFNVDTGEIERNLQEVIDREVGGQELVEPAARYYRALTGTEVTGELALRCNVEEATVLLNGREVGTTGEGPLVVRDLAAGAATLTIRHPDYAEHQQSVNIPAGELLELEVELSEDGGGTSDPDPDPIGTDGNDQPPTSSDGERSLLWLGWTSIGLGVVMGGLGLWGSLDVHFANNDSVLRTERGFWGTDVNVCDQAENGTLHDPSASDYTAADVADECGAARAWQALQFVFYGLGAAAIGVGIWLVIREMRNDDDESSGLSLRVEPYVLDGGGAVSATLTF